MKSLLELIFEKRIGLGQENENQLQKAIEKLPEKIRMVTIEYYYEKKSRNSIALTMNCSLATVNRNLSKAIFYLRKECDPLAFQISDVILREHLPNTVKY